MTAHQFLEQLYERPAYGMPSHQRRITPEQRELLERLIGQDKAAAAVERGFKRVTWRPGGRWYYIVDVDAQGRPVLTRLGTIEAAGAGLLF